MAILHRGSFNLRRQSLAGRVRGGRVAVHRIGYFRRRKMQLFRNQCVADDQQILALGRRVQSDMAGQRDKLGPE